jgi:NodT family efflux transporter outer membrane factor (OMF) lipoprotein
MPIHRGPVLALFTLLAGCAWGPGRPPSSSLALPSVMPVSQSPGWAGPWWTLYRDPALNAAVQEALTHNRDLRVAAANLLEVRAVLRETDTQRQPSTALRANAGYGRTEDDQWEAAQDQSQHIRTGTRYGVGLEVQWEVDLFGRLQGLVAASTADAESARAAEDGVRVLVAAQTTRAWLQACSDGQRLAVAQESLALAQRSQALTVDLRAAGAAVALDVARAQGLVEEVAASLPGLEARRQRGLAELAVWMGRLPAEVPTEARACTAAPEMLAPLPQADGLAMLRRRPDVRQAERQLAAATARIGVARAELYPRIALGAGVSSSAHHPDGLDAGGASVWQLGPLLSWSFPNISAARARIAQASARESAALARFDQRILLALKEQQQALGDYQGALQRQQALHQAARHYAEARRLAALARAAGATSALDELDALRRDVEARSQSAAADARVIDAQVLLFKAMGGGWRDAPAIALPDATGPAPQSSVRPAREPMQ